MTNENPTEAGTVDPTTPGDQATPESPEAEPTGGDAANSQRTDWKRLYLEEAKPKLEEANRIIAEYNALKNGQGPSPAAPGTSGANSVDDLVRKNREMADAGDPAAAMNLLIIQALQEQSIQSRLGAVPKDKQDRVKNHPRYRAGDVEGALADVQNADLAAEVEALRKRIAQSEKKPPDGPPTFTPSAPATTTHETLTAKQWETEQKTLSPLERMKRQKMYNEGKIVIDD